MEMHAEREQAWRRPSGGILLVARPWRRCTRVRRRLLVHSHGLCSCPVRRRCFRCALLLRCGRCCLLCGLALLALRGGLRVALLLLGGGLLLERALVRCTGQHVHGTGWGAQAVGAGRHPSRPQAQQPASRSTKSVMRKGRPGSPSRYCLRGCTSSVNSSSSSARKTSSADMVTRLLSLVTSLAVLAR